MAVIFMDGFDHYNQSEIIKKWDAATSGTSQNISTTTYRSGTGSLILGTNENWEVVKTFPELIDTVTVGFAQKIGTSMSSHGGWRLHNHDGVQCSVEIYDDGSIGFLKGARIIGSTLLKRSDSGIIILGSWQYLEFSVYIDNAGWYEVRVDGENVLSDSGVDTKYQTSSGVSMLHLGCCYSDNAYIDDLYICDSNSPNSSFLGDREVVTLYPSGSGHYSQFVASGETNNWECVTGTPATSGEYIVTSGENIIDTYQHDTLTAHPDDNIAAVQVYSMMEKWSPSADAITHFIRIGSSDYSGEYFYLPHSMTGKYSVFNVNPNDSAQWALSDVNDAEFGIKKEST